MNWEYPTDSFWCWRSTTGSSFVLITCCKIKENNKKKKIAICETSSSGTIYDSSLLLCDLQTTQYSLL
jgi:hypothetical protein